MKHKPKITILLLVMFLITQLIGLAVINAYSPKTREVRNETTGEVVNKTIGPDLPYGMQPPENMKEQAGVSIFSIIISLIIAVSLILILMKMGAKLVLRLWFLFVVIIGLAIVFNSILIQFNLAYSSILALLISIPLAVLKIFKRNFIIHNLTELLIYPGIGVVFVFLLSGNIWAVVILLLLLSAYDAYAVWHAGFMQKMAKYQINEVKVFNGFFVPYADKETKEKIKELKEKYKDDKEKLEDKKVKMNLGVLGGGDIAFPLIFAGVVFQLIGLLPAIVVSVFATLSLAYLLIFSKKGQFYPAMPFLTTGCLAGLLVGYFVYLL